MNLTQRILQILNERGRGVPADLLRPLRRHLPAARNAARGRHNGQRVLLRQQWVEVLPVHRAAESCQKEIQGGKCLYLNYFNLFN